MSRKSKGGRKGADNVLVDLGFDDAEELSARATLALKLNKLIDERGLNQAEASQLLSMPQPKISAIRNYKLQGISLERLMHALTALGQHVEISVTQLALPATFRGAVFDQLINSPQRAVLLMPRVVQALHVQASGSAVLRQWHLQAPDTFQVG